MKAGISILVVMLTIALSSTEVLSQDDRLKRPSPPAEAKAMIGDAQVNIYYSTPAVKGREIWNQLVPYGKVWRTGANEATVFETDKELTVAGHKLAPGKYALFTIPGQKEWTFILNSDWNQWGAFKYDKSQDVLRFTATPSGSPVFNERLRFDITENSVVLSWENLMVSFPVE